MLRVAAAEFHGRSSGHTPILLRLCWAVTRWIGLRRTCLSARDGRCGEMETWQHQAYNTIWQIRIVHPYRREKGIEAKEERPLW